MTSKVQGLPFSAAVPAVARPAIDADRAADSALCLLLAAYLVSMLLEGPLRYALAVSGAPNALYLRDVIPPGSVLFLFVRALLKDGRIQLPVAIAMALLACHAAWAAMLGVASFSIAFGLKVFMFIVYGMAMWPLLRRRLDAVLAVGSIMFAVAALGVFINYFVEVMPWEGLAYETAFGPSATTRMWWIPGGISRLPGFERTSFNAAMILGITGLFALVKFRHLLARLLICVVAMAAIVLTTSKGMMLAFPVAALWLILQDRFARLDGRLLVSALCAVSLVLPLVVVFWDVGSAMKVSSFPELVTSVWERFTSMWPLAFDILPEGPRALLGAGLGSIGTPQGFGHAPHRLNAGDSLAVYMTVNFGVLGLLYCAFPVAAMRKVAAANTPDMRRLYVSLLAIAYAYGLSINMIEESFFAFFFGLCFGAAASAWLGEPERAP